MIKTTIHTINIFFAIWLYLLIFLLFFYFLTGVTSLVTLFYRKPILLWEFLNGTFNWVAKTFNLKFLKLGIIINYIIITPLLFLFTCFCYSVAFSIFWACITYLSLKQNIIIPFFKKEKKKTNSKYILYVNLCKKYYYELISIIYFIIFWCWFLEKFVYYSL
jgi:hypothetical protein